MGFAAPPHDFYSFLRSRVEIPVHFANSDSCLKLLAGLSLDVSMKSSVQTPKSFPEASIMARKVSLLSFLLAGAGCCGFWERPAAMI